MTQYARIWTLKASEFRNAGDTVEVSLKSGKSKEVKLGDYLFSKEGFHYYATPEKQEA
jgi:hypothetical protein